MFECALFWFCGIRGCLAMDDAVFDAPEFHVAVPAREVLSVEKGLLILRVGSSRKNGGGS